MDKQITDERQDNLQYSLDINDGGYMEGLAIEDKNKVLSIYDLHNNLE